MKRILILGAGTAGTLMANSLGRRLNPEQWNITILDEHPVHYYQPGFLFLPFGIFSQKDVIQPRRRFLPNGVTYLDAEIDRVQAQNNRVLLKSGEELRYDILIIATGAKIAPEQTQGMLGNDWRTRVFDFYTFKGASALNRALRNWNSGRLVVHITGVPVKCSVAPLEFAFLADSWLKDRRLRHKTEIVYVTPLSNPYVKPVAAEALGQVLKEKRVKVVTDFHVDHIDNERHAIVSQEANKVDYDLLVTVPTNTGDVAMGRSGLANELNFVATNPNTLQSKPYPNIFVLGDATDLPSPKSSLVARFQARVVTANVVHYINGDPLESQLSGDEEGDRFVTSASGKQSECSGGSKTNQKKHRLPVLGPFLEEPPSDQFKELALRWIYGTNSRKVWRYRELAIS